MSKGRKGGIKRSHQHSWTVSALFCSNRHLPASPAPLCRAIEELLTGMAGSEGRRAGWLRQRVTGLPAPFPQACLEGIQAGSRHGWTVTARSVFVCLEGFLHTRQPHMKRGVSLGPRCPSLRGVGRNPRVTVADKGMAVAVSGKPAAPGLEQLPLIGPGLILCSYIATLWQRAGLNPCPSTDSWDTAQWKCIVTATLWLESFRFFSKSYRIFVIYCCMRKICLKADLGMCSKEIIQLSVKTYIRLHGCPRGIRVEKWCYPVPDKWN